MSFKNRINAKEEFRLLTSCIFEGMSNAQIAKRLNYSRSAVAYKMNKIFAIYGAKNRIDFVVKIFGEIIKTKKKELEKLNCENQKLKNTISEIIKKRKNINELEKLTNKIKKE